MQSWQRALTAARSFAPIESTPCNTLASWKATRVDLYPRAWCTTQVHPGGGYRPPDAMPSRLPPTYLVAGKREPFFLDNAARWASALHDASADVVMIQRSAGHDAEMWRQEFPLMIQWAFGRSPTGI